MRKFLLMLLCFALCLSVLVGCKDKEDEEPDISELPPLNAEECAAAYTAALTDMNELLAGEAESTYEFGLGMKMYMSLTHEDETVEVRGNNFMSAKDGNIYEMSEIDGKEKQYITTIRNPDGYTLYHKMQDLEAPTNDRAALVPMSFSEYERYQRIESAGSSEDNGENPFFALADFGEVSYERADGGIRVNCKGITNPLTAEYDFWVETLGDTVVLHRDSFEYYAIIKDGKLQSVGVKTYLSTKITGVTEWVEGYSEVEMTFHYTVDAISVPSDISLYQRMGLDPYITFRNQFDNR